MGKYIHRYQRKGYEICSKAKLAGMEHDRVTREVLIL